MKIYVDKWVFDNGEASFHITNIERCCDELVSNDEFITMSNEDYDKEYIVCIMNNYDASYGYGDYYNIDTEYKEIKYCPFCGEKIEIIFNKVDKAEEYNSLANERKTLNEKRRRTDSKKEERELSDKIYELDNKINGIHRSDNFESYFKGNNIELECE